MSAQDDVRTASDQFYAALNSMVNGDARPMADIWSHADTVTTMHPIGGRQVGWADVKASWAGVADLSTRGSVALTDQQIRVMGDVAYEVGVEHVDMTLAGDRFQGEFASPISTTGSRANGTSFTTTPTRVPRCRTSCAERRLRDPEIGRKEGFRFG
jgi:ketosteroid isomerase-like protein